VLRATKAAEETGVPAACIVATGFLRQAEVTAKALGSPGLRIVEYPGVIPLDSEEQLQEKVRLHVLPGVLEALQSEAASSDGPGAEPQPGSVVFRGSYDAVNDRFLTDLWSDGLPIVPPTRERVDAFLAWTERDPDEILGVLPPEFREATVLSVAVNGVMAGCRPEYMPILVAAVECIADPGFRLEDAGSTPGWEPLVVVSGEIVDAIDLNTEVGAMRVGRQANATIGRFIRLYMRNVAGFRPGLTDKGTLGFGFNMALGENEAAVDALGWDPYRVDAGFTREDNVVTVQSALAISAPVYAGGTDPETLARPLAHYLAGTSGTWFFSALWYSRWHPLIVMSPAVARGFADLGWGKPEIRRYLFEHTKIEAWWLEHYPLHPAGAGFSLAELVSRGSAPPIYAEGDDPNRLVPMLLREEWTSIVLAGDPQRNQSRIVVNNHEQGAPVSRRVVLPDGWRQRLARRR
jgi:hypothetical protein